MTPRSFTKREIAAAFMVFLLALWFRFGYMGVNSFAYDEARLSLISLRMARGGEFATVGMPSSTGVPNMPAAAWLFALPYAISTDPLVATWFVSALSFGAVVGVWLLARQWGVRAGIGAAFFLALNPYAVLYGRSVWAQNLLIPFGVMWLWAAYLAVIHTQSKRGTLWVGVTAFLSGFVLQVHFAGAALIIALAYLVIRFQWWRHLIGLVIGLMLAAICTLPFVLTPGALKGLLDVAGGSSSIDARAFLDLLNLIVGNGWSYLLHGESELPLARINLTIMNWGLGSILVVFLGLMTLFGAAAFFRSDGEDSLPDDVQSSPSKTVPTEPARLLELALILFFASPLFFVRHSTPVFLHYLLLSLPAAAVIVGWLLRDKANVRVSRGLAWLGLIIIFVWGAQLSRAFPYTEEHYTRNGMATPLGVLRQAAYSIERDRPIMYFTHGDDPNFDGEPAIFRVLWWGRGDNARIVDGRTVLILPPYPATIMFTERPFPAWEEMRASDLFVDLYEIPRREGTEPFQITSYDGDTMPAGFQMLEDPVAFSHGGVLLGWRTYTIGSRTRVSTLWRASGSMGSNIQQFHHLRTVTTLDGEPFMVADVSVRGHLWRKDDLIIVMGDFIDLEPGVEYTIEVGHYTLPDVKRVPLTGSNRDVVRLGTFQLE